MNGRRSVLHRALARVTAGLAVVAAGLATGLLLAPSAVADPTGEANDAITAAYDASGGPAGPLGVREGGVYPAGEGFGQNFAAGKMFFTPATGAHWMQGAILEKYESLGGPADGDLGFPTIDEGPGRVSPDSRNVTFSAPDKPVIFWTPATGARVVRGAINAAWDKLGGSSGVLGVPAEDEVYRGAVVSQRFTNGEVSWNRKGKTFTTVPPELAERLRDVTVPDDPASAIAAARRAAGGPLGPLGAEEGDQYRIGENGVGQNYAGGKIFYSPETGANVVTGQVLDKYESVGGPEGDLGFPTNSEADGGAGPNSRISTFAAADEPVIFWTPDYGAVIVRGAMNAAWSELDGAEGPLGAPIADQTENGDVITQRFDGGVISYDRASGKFSTEPANLAGRLVGLDVPGVDPPTTAPTPQPSAAGDDEWLSWRWNWWWLLALIPVLIVVGLVAGAVLWSRRRDRAGDTFAEDRFPGDRGPEGEEFFAPDVASGYPPADAMDAGAGPGEYPQNYRDSSTAYFLGGPEPTSAPDVNPWNPPGDGDSEPVTPPEGDTPSQAELFGGHDDPDSVDTAPTRVEVEPEPAMPPVYVEDAPSGRHAAIDVEEPTPGRTAIHLPLADSHGVPDGYPVKADTRSGLYWSPASPGYADAVAEIYFASEELARTNGFVRAG